MPDGEVLLDVSGLSVRFPTPDGVVNAVDDLSFQVRSRRDVRDRRRVRLRQERDQPRDARAAQPRVPRASRATALFKGRDLLTMPADELRRIRGKEIAMIFQDPFACLHPMYRVGDQIVEAIRAHERRAAAAGGRAGDRGARGRRHPEAARALPRLSPPVLGRHAPAGDDRDGPAPQPRRADRRRAHDRARRHRAGADPRADRPGQEGVRHRA